MDKLDNMAVMRKALESVNRFFRDCAMAHAGYEATSDIWSIVEKALAASPRNCDNPKFKTGWDVITEWQRRIGNNSRLMDCIDIAEMLDWLLAPATQEGDKP